MFLISIFGSIVAPLVVVLATYFNNPNQVFQEIFNNVNLFTVLILGVPLYGIVTSYLFNREYTENTLKNLLTIPVSRINLILSKMLLLFIWIMMLTIITWSLTLVLGMIAQFDGVSIMLLLTSFKQFCIGGILLFVLSSPMIFITVLMKNYVPTIILAVVIMLVNVMIAFSDHQALFPWSAVLNIASGTFPPTYPPEFSYIGIIAISFIGFISLIVYFKKVDIH
jgi:bacitracin transport system permease protein